MAIHFLHQVFSKNWLAFIASNNASSNKSKSKWNCEISAKLFSFSRVAIISTFNQFNPANPAKNKLTIDKPANLRMVCFCFFKLAWINSRWGPLKNSWYLSSGLFNQSAASPKAAPVNKYLGSRFLSTHFFTSTFTLSCQTRKSWKSFIQNSNFPQLLIKASWIISTVGSPLGSKLITSNRASSLFNSVTKSQSHSWNSLFLTTFRVLAVPSPGRTSLINTRFICRGFSSVNPLKISSACRAKDSCKPPMFL